MKIQGSNFIGLKTNIPSFGKLHMDESMAEFGKENLEIITKALASPEERQGVTIQDIINNNEVYLKKCCSDRFWVEIQKNESGGRSTQEIETDTTKFTDNIKGKIKEKTVINTIFDCYSEFSKKWSKFGKNEQLRGQFRPLLNDIEKLFNNY